MHPDDFAPLATMSDAHREWHRNAGVPMGTPGCPQDACHPPEPDCWDCFDVPGGCPVCHAEAARVRTQLLAEGWVDVDGELLPPSAPPHPFVPSDVPF